jgi:phosphoglycerate kinase
VIHYLRTAKKKDLKGIALLRLDFNTKEGDWRMAAVMPTVRLLAKIARAVLIVSHRGRPVFAKTMAGKPLGAGKIIGGVPHGFPAALSLKKDAAALSRLVGKSVTFINHFDFAKIHATIAKSPRGSIFLLENIRFAKEEEKNIVPFAKRLASLAESPERRGYYVNDAFAVSHRAEASVTAITKFLPSFAGLELEQEIIHLSRVMKKPKQPLIAIFGGAKAEDKLGVLKSFEKKARFILLGGGCANTILALRGMDVKNSIRDTDPASLRMLRALAARHNVIAPMDSRWGNGRILDIGPATAKDFSRIIAGAGTIVWSGPMGMTDDARYGKGTLAVARAIANNRKAFSVVGGGETVAFLKEHKLEKKMGFLSTGGGAMLDFLAGKKLPGIEALKNVMLIY